MAPQPALTTEPLLGWNGNVNGIAPGGLLGAASNYPYPLTSGLLGSLGSAPAGVPNFSQIALQMAGNPHAGPYSQVAPPSGVGVPGLVTPSATQSGGSSGSSTLGTAIGLLRNVQQGKNLYNGISGLLDPGVTPASVSATTGASPLGTSNVEPLMTNPAQAGITTPDGPLYSGATNANADLAAQEADQYAANGGLLGSTSDAGASSGLLGAYQAAASDVGAGSAASAAASAVNDAAPLIADTGAGDAAAAYGGSAAADSAAADTTAAGSGTGALGTAAGWAAPIAITALALMDQANGPRTAGTFLNSLQGTGSQYFTPQQQTQMQSAYQQLGEGGFWQWFHQNFPGWDTANRPNTRAAVQPT